MRKGLTAAWLVRFIILGSLFSLWQIHAAAAAVPPSPIRLLYATFDPVLEGEPEIPPALRAPETSPYALLQLFAPLTAGAAGDLQAAGVDFLGYLPEFTYLVRVSDPGAARSHPAVRWLGAYHPAYKISPGARGGRTLLGLFPGSDAAAAAAAVAAAGGTVLESSPAGDLLVVEAPAALLPALAGIEAVSWVQNAVQMRELNDDVRWVSQGNVPGTTPLTDHGLTGAGQVGGVGDSGLAVYDFSGAGNPNVPSCFFLDDGSGGQGGAALPPGPNHRKVVAYTTPVGAIGDTQDGSGHGSHVVGSMVGDRGPWNALSPHDGQAFAARVFFQDIGIGGFPLGLINPPSDYRVLFGQAYDGNGDGVYQPALEPRTHSNSWGSGEPIYSVEAMQTDDFTWTHPDFLIFFAAGNQGPGPSTIGQPATAKNIVTVGATENGLGDPDSMGYFSSHGPGPLGRLNPTVSAPGDRVTSALSGSPCGTTERIGTSMATPAVHGLALLMRQYLWDGYYPAGTPNPADRRHPSAALLKGLLISGGRPMGGAHTDNGTGGAWPSNGQGWGRVTADDALYFQGDHRGLWLVDEYALDGSAGFDATGQSRTFTLAVGDGRPFQNEPLKIVLSWSDYPGLPPAGGALVNNLDLVVTGPDGTVYRGNDPAANDFRGTPELPPAGPDAINPWEVVYLENPAPGTYTIRVTAAHIASTVLDGSRKQGFALVTTGDLPGRQGRAAFEYPTYQVAPRRIARLRVSDLDLNQKADKIEAVAVAVTNTRTGAQVPATLTEVGANSGIFAGQVVLTAGTPGRGELAVLPGDTIRLAYADADNGRGAPAQPAAAARIAPAPVNFVNPPDLADPGETDADGRYTLTWSPPERTAGLSAYLVEEATQFTLVLADDGEGSLAANWTAGQANARWTSDGTFAHSGSRSYWSGRGDIQFFIDTALTLNREVTIPAGAAEARLSFYSRYYNDANDYGHVEISVAGGPWTRLRRLYADPRLVPAGGRMQHHEFDLSATIGQPLRLRFRYDNGIASIAPDSPGWWIDDVTISAGTWQTIGVVGPEETAFEVTGRPAGTYYYRVSALYADGGSTGRSPVVDMVSEAPADPAGESGPLATGGGWLAGSDGQKINFGFRVSRTAAGYEGNLQFDDRATGIKIHLSAIESAGPAGDECGAPAAGGNGFTFIGTGRVNSAPGARVRVCVEDAAEPGRGADRFSLTCLAGCTYAGTAADDVIDGGNIQVRGSAAAAEAAAAGGEPRPATLILTNGTPVDGLGGLIQPVSVAVYDQQQAPLPGAAVTLTHTGAGGVVTQITAVTGPAGLALFELPLSPGEMQARIGGLESNAAGSGG